MNRIFSEHEAARVLEPARWRVISTMFGSDVRPVRDAVHAAWRRRWLHAHAYPEILFVLSGECRYGLGDSIYRCPPGTVMFLDQGESHDATYPPDAGAIRHLWISLLHDRIVCGMAEVRNRRPVWREDAGCVLLHEDAGVDIHRFLAQARAGGLCSPAAAAARFRAMLMCIMGGVVEAGARPAAMDARRERHAETLEAIRRHLMATGGRGTSLDQLARIAGYSKFHFLRLFREATGQTVGEYVDVCRLRRVEVLRREGRALKEIGMDLGFSCQSAFSRWLRRHKVDS